MEFLRLVDLCGRHARGKSGRNVRLFINCLFVLALENVKYIAEKLFRVADDSTNASASAIPIVYFETLLRLQNENKKAE